MLSANKLKLLFFVWLAAAFVILAPVSDLAQESEVEEAPPAPPVVEEAVAAIDPPPVEPGGASEEETASTEVVDASPEAGTVEVQFQSLPFQMPFSLNDCLNLIGAATSTLPKSPDEPLRFKPESYQRLVAVVSNYLDRRDDLHFSWVGYEWKNIARRRVTGGLIEQVKVGFEGQRIPQGVSALRFDVENEDIYLHSLRVYDSTAIDENGDVTGNPVIDHQFDEPQMLRHSLPRDAIFHLLRPNDIALVDLAVSLVNPEEARDARIIIMTGKTDKPEYVKSAIWSLDRANEDVAARDWVQAREHLKEAQEDIRLLRRALRLAD